MWGLHAEKVARLLRKGSKIRLMAQGQDFEIDQIGVFSRLYPMNARPVQRDSSLPRHVAIVMDGNGRWAKRRFLPRFFGHKQGVDALRNTVAACLERKVRVLTVFAFSSENWRRPEEEVSLLMRLFIRVLRKDVEAMHRLEHGAQVAGPQPEHPVLELLDHDPAAIPAEVSTLLDLARDAAHEVERVAAPLTTFLAGVAVGLGNIDVAIMLAISGVGRSRDLKSLDWNPSGAPASCSASWRRPHHIRYALFSPRARNHGLSWSIGLTFAGGTTTTAVGLSSSVVPATSTFLPMWFAYAMPSASAEPRSTTTPWSRRHAMPLTWYTSPVPSST